MSIKKILKAARFAAEKHRSQRRKNGAADPYINHPIQVAELLAEVGGVGDESLLIAALLHDTIEDTDTTHAEIAAEFGDEVLKLVLEVTDDKTLSKEERKRLQIVTAPRKSIRAKQLKLADKIANLSFLADDPPPQWSLNRQIGYFEWAEKVVEGLRGCNANLEKLFDRIHDQGIKKLQNQRLGNF